MCHKKVNILRLLSLLVAIAVLLSALGGLNVSAAESGKCGEKLEWSFSGSTLVISGKGAMNNYDEQNKAPWYDFREEITTVILPKGLESIGVLAFYDCTALKAVVIPEGVTIINNKAFYNCTALKTVTMPNSLKTIGKAAFFDCGKLAFVTLPQGLEKIGDKAFYLCRSLVTLTIPETVENLGEQAFAYCESLLSVDIKAKIDEIPAWCFYGCTSLMEIKLSSTVKQVDSYAFGRCNSLNTIYSSAGEDVANKIKKQIVNDLPSFASGGSIIMGELSDVIETTQTETDKKGNEVQNTNTSVETVGGGTLVSQVQTTIDKGKSESHLVLLTLTIESKSDWDKAILAVREKLFEINSNYATAGELEYLKITLYLKGVDKVNEDFLKELAGRNIILEVISKNGSTWLVNCLDLKFEDVKSDTGISSVVTEATDKAKDKLGTENCYEVEFESSTNINTNVVITLPKPAANGNAFLYEVKFGGRYKLVQSSVVDSSGNARFYLSSINKNGKYVIGINVPGESVDNVIIPDEASDPFGAIARLEKIEYVPAGPRTLAGFTIGEFTLILLGVLLFIAIVVGICVYMIFKNRKQQPAFVQGFIKKAESGKKLFKKHNKK